LGSGPLISKPHRHIRRDIQDRGDDGRGLAGIHLVGRLDLKSTLRPRGRPKQPLAALSPKYRRVRQKLEVDKST
jgi:hypothetical protein